MSVSVAEQSLKKYRFSLPVKVRFADIDLQENVFLGNYITYCKDGIVNGRIKTVMALTRKGKSVQIPAKLREAVRQYENF